MDDPLSKTRDLSSVDATLDSTPRGESAGTVVHDSSMLPECCRPVAVVEGSGPELTRETQELLRRRLRLAAVILFAGFAAFLVVHYVQTDFSESGSLPFFILHVVTTIVLGALAAALRRYRVVPVVGLRASELVIFGLPAVVFLVMQYFLVLECCERGYFSFPAGSWLVLIFTYALFIPNTIRRAAIVIGLITVAPMLLFAVMLWTNAELARLVQINHLMGIPLMLILSAVGSVFGVDTIGSLRREAFEARQLGQYRLTRRIGVGGMGEVYLAEHQLMKRPCVVKLIRPDKAGDAKVLARFQREVRATAKLSHWNTVEIFDYGSTEDGTFYYVMEYLPGMSLAELVRCFGPLPAERVIHLLRQACDALREAHAAGLIHRDIKPGNIFAAQRGGVYDVTKLLDFGLVKPLTDDQPIELTTEGAITGSPLYMSPEQATGDRKPDARSDIYSLGAVGYFLLTGRPPFEGDRPIKVIIAHAHDEVVPPSQHVEGIPADLEQIFLRCLAKDPADRFDSATSLAEALAGCEAADGWTRARAAAWWQQEKQEQAG